MKKIISTMFFLASFNSLFLPQSAFEPFHNDVYDFLIKMDQRGFLRFDDRIKPVSRMEIFEALKKLKLIQFKLNKIEKEELDFYLNDYYLENELLKTGESETPAKTFIGKDEFGRRRLLSYSDELFKINVSPIIGVSYGSRDNEMIKRFYSGVYFFGYLGANVAFSFDYRDNSEAGKTIDAEKLFNPETGIIASSKKENSIEYSEVKTSVAYDWSWGRIAAGKEFFEWGSGESGNIVLSRKAPSFPFIRLDLKPAEWLRFNYIHGWLNSYEIDSNEMYKTSLSGVDRILYREKYFASHTLSFYPLDGLSVSFGESIIYSDRYELAYLFPLMFFRLSDHYLSGQNNSAGANSQFFLGIESRGHVKNTRLYGSLFIDEITISGLFDSYKRRNQLGFSLGGSVVDLPINNLRVSAEYVRILPFVYRHYIPAQTYENSGYLMGHWIGHNSDLIYVSADYTFLRRMNFKIWAHSIRKGEDGIPEQQYVIQPQPPFLFGLRKNYLTLGAEFKYEPIRELYFELKYFAAKSRLQNAGGEFDKTALNEFYLSVYYGM